MDKGLYELKINEALEHVMPPLQEMELELLTQSLLNEGCRDPLVVWQETGELVDGHNRYRICRESNIPFGYMEMSFGSETAAKTWIIKNQLARRNVSDYVRCELVLPLEAELKAEAEKRMLAGVKKESNPVEKLPQGSGKTRDALAELAGISGRTFDKARKLAELADEETKEKLRNGDLSIHGAYTALKRKEEPIAPEPVMRPGDIAPGFGVAEILPEHMKGYTRPPDSVYDIPPIKTYGMMPADDMECRGRAEMAYITQSLRKEMENCRARVQDILRKMTSASINEENIATLKQMVNEENGQIMEWFDQMLEEENDYE